MSGPSRELPPLVVKITADSSKLKKGLEDAVKAAKEAADSITKNFGKANLDQIKQRRETLRRLGAVDRAYAKQRMSEDKESRAKAKQASDETAEMRKANQERNKEVERSRKEIEKQARFQQMADKRATSRMWSRKRDVILQRRKDLADEQAVMRKANADRNAAVEESRRAIEKQSRYAQMEQKRETSRMWSRKRDVILQRRKDLAEEKATIDAAMAEQRRQVEQSRKNIERQSKQQAADDKRATSRMWSRKRDRIVQMRRAAVDEANEEQRVLRRSRLRRVRTGRARQEAYATSWRNPGTWGGRVSRGLEAGGGNMMGARADMYMHRQSLQGMIGGAASFLRPAADMQTYAVGIKQFTANAAEAKQVITELQDFALLSPYTMSSVMEGTTLMMRYGMEAKDAVDTTKMLGDVAGGNADKLRLLALAVGQSTSMGRLQGQELRQMTEHGFNPLQIAAEYMLGPNASKEDIKKKTYEFSKLMRAGRIDSEFIMAAMRVATSEGGKYAGLMAEYNKTILGMTNQIIETLEVARQELGKLFEKEIEAVLKNVLRYASALVLYLRDPKNAETIKYYSTLVVKIFLAVAAFHAFGMAVAYTKWMLGSLLIVLGAVWKILLPFRWLLGQLAYLFVQLAIQAVSGLTAMQLGFAAATLGAFAFGAAIAYVLYNANADIIKFNQELKKAQELQEDLNGIDNRRHREEMAKIMEEQDPAKRKQMATDLMARYETELSGKNTNIERQKALIAAYEPQASRAFQSAQLPLTKKDYEEGRRVGRVVGRQEWVNESENLKLLENSRRTLKSNIEALKDQTGIVGSEKTAFSAFDPKTWLAGLEPYLKDMKENVIPKLTEEVNFDKFIRPEDPEEAKAARQRMAKGVSDAEAGLPSPTLRGSATHAERLYKYDQMMKGESKLGTPAEQKQISLLERIAKNTQFITSAGGMPDTKQATPQWASFVSGPTN